MDITAIIAIISALLALIAIVLNTRRSNQDEQDKRTKSIVDICLGRHELENEKRFGELNTSFAGLRSEINSYWRGVENRLANQLHSPHSPEIDIYLDKIINGTITAKERKTFSDVLYNGVVNNLIHESGRTSAEVLLAIQEIILNEKLN